MLFLVFAKVFLEEGIEVFDADIAFVHGGDHLDIFEGIDVKALRDALGDEFADGLCALEGVIALDEVKVEELVCGGFGEDGKLALIDQVGVFDDQAIFFLSEDLVEARDGDLAALQQIAQDIAGSNGGELIDVADEQKL